MTNGLTRGVPVQDLPENQDESVAFFTDEVTKAVFPFDPSDFREQGTETPSPRKRRKRKVAGQADAPDVEEALGDAGDAPVEEAASDPTSLREVGS